MTDAEREAIHAAIGALPPMTEEQIEAIAEVIIVARERRRHTCQTSRGPRCSRLTTTHARWPATVKCN